MTTPADLNLDEPRKRVAVIAAPAETDSPLATDLTGAAAHPNAPTGRWAAAGSLPPDQERTLAALEQVLPVRFERGGEIDLSGVDGVVVLGAVPEAEIPAGPRLVLPAGAAPAAPGQKAAPVSLTGDPALARPLRGRAIPESATAGELAPAPAGSTVLARVEGRPVWWQRGGPGAAVTVSAYHLAGCNDGETLREHLRAGRFMGLLALVHFLGQLVEGGWRLPPPRAAFLVDDPNLHRPSYGYLKYGELAAHAVRHGYHIGFATVPLDGWWVNPRVTALLAKNTAAMSLSLHGNDHVAQELGRLSTDAAALGAIAQALRRIAAMERRSGVSVDRVMVPPHGVCSQAAMRAMFRLGIEATCSTHPHPWRHPLGPATPTAGWHPAEMVAGGLPVLLRYPLGAPTEDLALRALLGQPLIVYGHHDDFAQGLDVLAQTASEINGYGDVRWGPLGEIARRSYTTRQTGDTLLVKMYARRISVEVPAGVRTVRVLVQEPYGGAAGHRLTHAGGSVDVTFEGGTGTSVPLSVDAPTSVEVTQTADRPLRPAEVPSQGIKVWPLIRRTLVEGRDHVQALR